MGGVIICLIVKPFHNSIKQIIMLADVKNQSETLSYWLIIFFIFLLLGIYGKQFIEWLLMMLYEFFINKI